MVESTQNLVNTDVLRWIPLIPLLGSVINLFFGRALGKQTAGILASAAVAASFGLALYILLAVARNRKFS
jgi:NADH:ubiquinone oxidoreductase subunit 5 (subunit L)/multisubunit Na+/H+ antiporter MnhA subunit